MSAYLVEEIKNLLDSKDTKKALMELFLEVLNWEAPKNRPFTATVSKPVGTTLEFVPIAQMSGLAVFMVKWPFSNIPNITQRRAVYKAVSRTLPEHLLCFVTEDQGQIAFVRARKRKTIRESKGPRIELRMLPYEKGHLSRTTVERLSYLHFPPEEIEEVSPVKVMEKLDTAFDVQALSEEFYEGFKSVFDRLQKELLQQTRDPKWAHDFALQFLNRIMFLYFIQRKTYSDGTPWLLRRDFMRYLWNEYKRKNSGKDEFFTHWLKPLFFEAFNQKISRSYEYQQRFPQEILDILQQAPYLNGGLFTENQLDKKYDVKIPDSFFTLLFERTQEGSTPGFFERYNFTISEETPFDKEVAVNPEMIGTIYESLVNITAEGIAEEDRRGKSGIFYTPRVEIDLMNRVALVDWLSNHLGEDKRLLLYEWVFAYEPEDKEAADKQITEHALWEKLAELLKEVKILDPACGSGSFLVSMLLILDDLWERINDALGEVETPYDRRNRIIKDNLYGVDVMDWAVQVAELRLWLQLTVETDIDKYEAKLKPLLPNLSFKIRQGDSLVQEYWGVNFSLLRLKHGREKIELPQDLKGSLSRLKGAKRKFFSGRPEVSEAEIRRKERELFREIINYRIKTLQKELKNLQFFKPQKELDFGGVKQESLDKEVVAEKKKLQKEIDELQIIYRTLQEKPQNPFVWDMAFLEIFEKEKQGFDIVVGNPPYVRQEKIEDPLGRFDKRTYKEKLQTSLWHIYPSFFGFNNGKPARTLDRKSDYYIYFYLHALSLLNPKGSFCFITSNSWLDVGFGKDLQEFLLRHSHIKMIIDNRVKRSFAQADVNTIIALLAPPDDRTDWGLEKEAHFVMFHQPFEDVIHPVIFEEIEESRGAGELKIPTFSGQQITLKQKKKPEYTLRIIKQKDLYLDGAQPKTTAKKQEGLPSLALPPYKGNKWGGKFLRAPEIFFTILQKGKGKLVRLGDIAEVRRGFTTGANEFFYVEDLTDKIGSSELERIENLKDLKSVEEIKQRGLKIIKPSKWGKNAKDYKLFLVEAEYLKPVIKSPRELKTIIVREKDLKYRVLMCNKAREELKGSFVLDYIKWGEEEGYHKRPSCEVRERWWEIPNLEGNMFWVKESNNRLGVFISKEKLKCDCRLYYARGNVNLQNAVNSTLFALISEILARGGLGEGAKSLMVYEVNNLIVINPVCLRTKEFLLQNRKLKSIFEEIGIKLSFSIRSQNPNPLPDRKALDDIVFDALGLTPEERKEVYYAVAELVQSRLQKARSV